MNIKETATLANFNCTFKYSNTTFPMLEYFEKIIWPAFNDKNLIRIYKNNRKKELITRYHISDIEIIEMTDGNLALIGKHIKRTILDISEDYSADKGFFGQPELKPSAPYSTFILLLKNHRLIYFPNKTGAPNIVSFASTVRSIVNQFIDRKRVELLNSLSKDDYPTKEALKFIHSEYPAAEINIVPIESENLVNEAFSQIASIKNVKFKFYKPNNEAIDTDNLFELSYSLIDSTNSKSLEQTLNSPQNISVIEDAVNKSKGKADYKINAINSKKEPFQITPNKVSPKHNIIFIDSESVANNSLNVYNQLKDRNELKEVSKENSSTFKKFMTRLKSLKKK